LLFKGTLFEMRDTPQILLLKTYATVCLSFAARGCESFDMNWEDITQFDTDTGEKGYRLTYYRSKSAIKEANFALVLDPSMVTILDNYAAAFDEKTIAEKGHRYFRKLSLKNNRIVGTNQVIGKHTASNYGKKLLNCWESPTLKLLQVRNLHIMT
jgi:hypothetical protein